MKFDYLLHENTRIPSEAYAKCIDDDISSLPQRLLTAFEEHDVKISIAETVSELKNWFPEIESDGFAGLYLPDMRVVCLVTDRWNSVQPVYSDTPLHECIHACYFALHKRIRDEFSQIYNLEVNNYNNAGIGSPNAKDNHYELFVASVMNYIRYKVENNDIEMMNLIFGKTTLIIPFLEKEIFNSKSKVLNMIEDMAKDGVSDVALIPANESVSGKDGIKVHYKDGTWSAFDLPISGGGGTPTEHFIIRDDTINFSTSYSGIPIGKIVYSYVQDNTRCWLLISTRLKDNYEITQDRILLQTNTSDIAYRGTELTERRYFDYNGSRQWSSWKKVNKENLTSVSLSNSKYTLTKGEFQKINNNGNASAVVTLPSVSDYTPIKLIVTCNTTGTISFEHARPIKWNTTALSNITSGKTYEIDMQYIDYATGWICKYNTY